MIAVPDAYAGLVEDLRLLRSDDCNPNRMSSKQKEQVWMSLQRYGWTYPVITNKDGVFADGEQRAQACKDHGEFYAPVLRLPVSDVDRRMLRQILNKLRGRHSRDLDAAEYARIVAAGEKDGLKALLKSVGEELPAGLEGEEEKSCSIPDCYELVVDCKDEAQQRCFFEKLRAEGYRVRVLNL